jgi:outer membrane protein
MFKSLPTFSRLSLLAAPFLIASNLASADIVGGEVSVSYWNAGYGGDVRDRNSQDLIDLERDLKFDDAGFLEFSASLEHPVPLLPNVRLKHIDLDESSTGSISVVFDGVNFAGNVDTTLDLTHSSVALYYELLDNVVSLDVGLEAKLFDGQLRIDDGSNVSETKIDDPIPLLYVAADVELPLTGLTVGTELSGISFSGDRILDAKAKIRYGMGLVFIEGGYRSMSIKVDDVSDIDVDADLSGAYISTGIDF